MIDFNRVTPYGMRVHALSAQAPDASAIIFIPQKDEERVVTRRELDDRSTQIARLLAARGVGQGSMVVVALPNSPEHAMASIAAWKLGACVLPLNPRAPERERDQLLNLANPTAIVADWPDVLGVVSLQELLGSATLSADPLPAVALAPGKAIGTGGSTGRPKLIVQSGAWGYSPEFGELLSAFGMRPGITNLVPGPLYHNYGFDWFYIGLVLPQTIVLMERFEATRAVQAIQKHGVQYAGFVPTMMARIAKLPDLRAEDLASIEVAFHSAAPCPPWVKLAWIELIGATRVLEGYGASEGFGNCLIRGDDWLAHPGSIGKPWACDIRIVGDDGNEVQPGTIGEVFMRRQGGGSDYVGAPQARQTGNGFKSVGDLGWMDENGFVYLADRRSDLIISGGANIYPAEIESALTEHPAIADAVVIGLPDEDMGKRAHAILQIQPGRPTPTEEELIAHCREHIAGYKIPRSFEFVAHLPRDDGGKIRRAAIAADRAQTEGRP